MLKKISLSLVTTLLFVFIFVGVSFAAPGGGVEADTAVFFAEAVNLPGWLGGLMAALSIILPVGTFIWMKQNNP